MWSCIPYVAAMITGEKLEEVIKFIGHDGSEIDSRSEHPSHVRGFLWQEIVAYLASKNYILGLMIQGEGEGGVFEVEWNKVELFRTDIAINLNAVVSVRSTRLPGCWHMVYWDGENVYDPQEPEVTRLEDYDVMQWAPVFKFDNPFENKATN